MNDAKREKDSKKMIDTGLMSADDQLVDSLECNHFKPVFGCFGNWAKGRIYFTEKSIVYPRIINEDFIIPYNCIQELGKCRQTMLPIGIVVTYKHPKTGNIVTTKFSLMKRDYWIEFMTARMK